MKNYYLGIAGFGLQRPLGKDWQALEFRSKEDRKNFIENNFDCRIITRQQAEKIVGPEVDPYIWERINKVDNGIEYALLHIRLKTY